MKVRTVVCAGTLPALALLAGCSSAAPFSDIVGNLRVTGQITQSLFSHDAGMLKMHVYDASTGYPVDVKDVEVKAGNSPPVHATRPKLGTYSANIADPERVDLFIKTRDRGTVFIALRQQ